MEKNIKPIPIYQVDAFTDKPFAGNPAAVCIMPEYRDDAWLQNLAAEMNLAETAFLCPQGDDYRLRWCTPKVEVELCGHATLASAHILWQEGYVPAGKPLRFHSLSGVLQANQRGDLIELDFPAKPPEPCDPPPGLLDALGAKATYIGRNKFDYLVEVATEEELRSLSPNFVALANIDVRGTIVTSRSASAEFNFISRFFAPAAGINEDPVTGSAHCCLGPYWQSRLNKSEFVAYQASPRGGIMHVRVEKDRAYLGGQGVTVFRGHLDEGV